jgi:hypothetical protein
MRRTGGVEMYFRAFMTSASVGGEWSVKEIQNWEL